MRLDIDHTPRWYYDHVIGFDTIRRYAGRGPVVAVQMKLFNTYYTLWW